MKATKKEQLEEQLDEQKMETKIFLYGEILRIRQQMLNDPEDEVGQILYQQEIDELYKTINKFYK